MHVGTDFLKLPPVTGQYWSLFQCSMLGTGGTCGGSRWGGCPHRTPRIEEEQLPLGCLLVPPLLGESGGLGLRGSEAEAGGRLGIHKGGQPWLWIRAWSLGRRADGRSGKEQQSVPLGRTWKAVMSGLRRTVSAMRFERARGSLLRRMDLVMRTRAMVVPGGQVTAELVGMAVSWNVCPSGREHPRVPAGPVTAAILSQAKGQADP